MSALARMFLIGALVLLGFSVAYPDWTGSGYHARALAAIGAGALAAALAMKFLDLGAGAAKLALELLFFAGAVLAVGRTLPQASGRPPLVQWAEGLRPTRGDAKRGLKRLGLDPGSRTFKPLVKLLPR